VAGGAGRESSCSDGVEARLGQGTPAWAPHSTREGARSSLDRVSKHEGELGGGHGIPAVGVLARRSTSTPF
jgi:hypothetical protein